MHLHKSRKHFGRKKETEEKIESNWSQFLSIFFLPLVCFFLLLLPTLQYFHSFLHLSSPSHCSLTDNFQFIFGLFSRQQTNKNKTAAKLPAATEKRRKEDEETEAEVVGQHAEYYLPIWRLLLAFQHHLLFHRFLLLLFIPFSCFYQPLLAFFSCRQCQKRCFLQRVQMHQR